MRCGISTILLVLAKLFRTRLIVCMQQYPHLFSGGGWERAPRWVSGHRAPHLAAIGPALVQKYASPARLSQPAAPCDRLFRGYLTFVGLPRDWLPPVWSVRRCIVP